MKKSFTKKPNEKGFTLIELLIVITIIGILAVAFLPTLLGAPARGRDTQRVADLQKIQKVFIDADLTGDAYPTSDGCIGGTDTAATGLPGIAAFGGAYPADPQSANSLTAPVETTNTCIGGYGYVINPNNAGTVPSGSYAFGLYTRVENAETGNTTCALAVTGDLTDNGDANDCYAILVQ